MDADKKTFYDVAINMHINSSILFSDNCNSANHGSVYLAGYVLEAYIKVLLLNYGEPRYFGHVGDEKFINKFRRIMALHPEITDILHDANPLCPKTLLNGHGGNDTLLGWDINHRYKVSIWRDNDFVQNIQREILNLKTELIRLRIDGALS